MAHIFFERLENRRSTQSLYAGYTTPSSYAQYSYGIDYTPPTSLGRYYYGVSYPDSSPISYPSYPSTGYFPSWDSGYNPFPSYSPYSIWNNQFNQYSSPWMNPFPDFFGGIGNFFSPFQNMFQGFFGWQPSYRQPSPWTPIFEPPGYSPPIFGFPNYTNSWPIDAIGKDATGDFVYPWGGVLYGVGIPTGASSAKLF